jgi:hypothetical protein
MYSHNIPAHIDEYVNVITYPIEVPEYAMMKARAYKDGDIINIFEPDKNLVVQSRATVAQMIDFNFRVIPFKILYAHDILEIYKYLETYIDELQQFNEIEEAQQYLIKAKDFFGKLERSVNILARHGNAEARAQHERKEIVNIFKVALGGSS